MTPPLRPAAAGLLAGSAIGRAVPAPDAATLAAAAVVTILVTAGLAVRARARARDGPGHACLLVAIVAAALAAGLLRAAAGRPVPFAAPEVAVAEVGAVALAAPEPVGPPPPPDLGGSDRPATRGWGFRADAGGLDARVTFDLPPGALPPDVLPGDRIRVVGRVRTAAAATNPGAGRRPGAPLEVEAASVSVLERGPRGVADAVRRGGEVLRRAARARLVAACGGETPAAGLFACVLTGDRSGLPPEVSRAFRDSGTAHVLAVSGLHLVLLVAIGAAVARRVTPRAARLRLALPATALLVIVYAAVCRFETPVVRSGVFVLVGAAARCARRRSSTTDHLALAATLVVAADPDQVADVGFQLSFAAVAGLALLTGRFRNALFPRLRILLRFPESMSRRRMRLLLSVSDGLATSFAAQAATAPVVAATFGTAQPFGPFANLVAVPLFACVLPFTLVLAAAGGACVLLTRPAGEVVAAVFVGTADAAAVFPLGHLALGRPPPFLLAAGIAVLAAAARLPAWRRRDLWAPGLAWALVALGPGVLPRPAAAECVALDVGHGLAVLVRGGDGVSLLYDAGGRAPGLGDRTIVPALRELGVRRLAFLCLSHEDSDHCGAAEAVVREMAVGAVVVPAGFGASPLARSVLGACEERGVPVTALVAGDRIALGGLSATALHPSEPAASGAENPESLVLRVRASGGETGPLDVLLTGDVEGPPLAALARRDDIPPSHVLVLPHHGRGVPWPHDRLAAAVRAEILVASASDPATVVVRSAWITGACGAIRIRAGRAPEAWPWRSR